MKMWYRLNWQAVIMVSLLAILAVLFPACSSSTTPTGPAATTPATSPVNTTSPTGSVTPRPGGPGGEAIVNSDSIITAKITAIHKQTTGYPWEVDILVQSSADVGTLPNPTKDKVGQVITTKTDEDLSAFKVNQLIAAKVKYVGDVPLPGITMYLYNIKLQP